MISIMVLLTMSRNILGVYKNAIYAKRKAPPEGRAKVAKGLGG